MIAALNINPKTAQYKLYFFVRKHCVLAHVMAILKGAMDLSHYMVRSMKLSTYHFAGTSLIC